MSLQTKIKNVAFEKFGRFGIAVIGISLSAICYQMYVRPWFRKRKYARAEELANMLYEERQKKAVQQTGIKME